MTIILPDLSRYTNIRLTVSLAAADETSGALWELTHRDSLVITGSTGTADYVIDTFRPTRGSSIEIGSPLQSALFLVDLHPRFQDFTYSIPSDVRSLTFAFA